MLLREVYGWLRYSLKQDPKCVEEGIVAEEIPASFLNLQDPNSGPRVLAIYKEAEGLTPRIEVRFTYQYPQIWFVSKGEGSDYVASPNIPGFPGDTRSYDVSETVELLINLAKVYFCQEPEAMLEILPRQTAQAASPKISFEDAERIVNAVKNAVDRGTTITPKKIDQWLKANSGGDLMDFALAVVEYFRQGKFKFEDIDVLEDEYPPGKDIIHWRFFQKQIGDNKELMGKVPPTFVDRFEVESHVNPKAVRRKLDAAVAVKNDGGDPVRVFDNGQRVHFGLSVIAHLNSNKLPLPYLNLMECADPRERILPWSFIRRNVVAYRTATLGKKKEDSAEDDKSIADLIIQWLEKSNLMFSLYKAEKGHKDALVNAVRKDAEKQTKETVGNAEWVKTLLKSFINLADELAVRKGLQVEFDLWMLKVLGPTAEDTPLSPHAFTAARRQEVFYQNIFSAWLNDLKETYEKQYPKSVKALSSALKNFYALVIKQWKTDQLKDYKFRVPSQKEITEAVRTADKDKLMAVLLKDLEDEVGTPTPRDVKSELSDNPQFNTIFEEIIFQTVRLP